MEGELVEDNGSTERPKDHPNMVLAQLAQLRQHCPAPPPAHSYQVHAVESDLAEFNQVY
jgi:hypothetical protein